MDDLQRVDLSQRLFALAPRLRRLAGADVQLELRCLDGLCPALPDDNRLESLVGNVVELLSDLGSEQIRIETRAVAEGGYAPPGPTVTEILIWGRGRGMDPLSSSQLIRALDLSDMDPLTADVDVRSEADGAVRVRVRLPLLGPAPGRWSH